MTKGIYDFTKSVGSDWACVKVVATWSNSYYIRSVIKSATTNSIRVAIIRINLGHIRSKVIATVTSDNRIIVTRTKSNPSTNNCTVVNKGIIKTTTHFVYNRKSNSASN